MANLNCDIPASLLGALTKAASGNGSISHIVTAALSQYLNEPVHTLFQISTSRALVAGLNSGVITAEMILRHGDFGLGTFANLDGEMVVLDGRVYQVRGDGTVSEAPADAAVPFAVVTRFACDLDRQIAPSASLQILTGRCDENRPSSNIFYAFRLDGVFHQVRTRAVQSSEHGRFIEAAKAQAEFEFRELPGTLVGLWSPGFSSAFSIPGYHFHFISDDRQHGGHLLACSTGALHLRKEALTDFHLALPETESFLKADLSKSAAAELAYAEAAH